MAVLEGITGVVSAGGAGKRLGGVPKGLIEVGGEALLARTLRLFDELFAQSMLIANDDTYAAFDVETHRDVIPRKGAPGGLHAALTHARTDWIFLAACDMPSIDRELIVELAAERHDFDIVVCQWNGRPEPLHALYHRRCLESLTSLMEAGDPSFRDLFDIREVNRIEARSGTPFRSINTPQDLADYTD